MRPAFEHNQIELTNGKKSMYQKRELCPPVGKLAIYSQRDASASIGDSHTAIPANLQWLRGVKNTQRLVNTLLPD